MAKNNTLTARDMDKLIAGIAGVVAKIENGDVRVAKQYGERIRKLDKVAHRLVRSHDQLAERTDNLERIKGKRGRKVSAPSPVSADDVLADV